MNLRTILACSAVLGLLAAGDAAAQKLSLHIDKGLVTLDAQNVTVDEVLARWIDTTGLNVISKSGQGSDIPVSLQIEGVPEREALRMVLRDLSGYIMGERVDPRTGVVMIDRLMILPQSAAQATAPTGPPRSPFQRGVPSPPVVVEPSASVVAPTFELQTPVELAPAPRRGSAAGRLIGRGPGAVLDLTGGGEPNVDPALEVAPEAPAPPASPFGNSRGAARPGETTPPLAVEAPVPILRSMSADGPPPTAAPPASDDAGADEAPPPPER